MLKRECFHKLLLRHSQGEWNAFSRSFHKQNSFLLAYINISIAQILIMILCFTLVKPWGLARPLACWEEPRIMVSSEGPRPVKASIRPSGESVKHVWQWVKLLAYAQQVEGSQLWAWGATIVSQSWEREARKEKLKSPGLLVRQGPSLRSRKGCDAKPQERRSKSWQPASGIDSGHCRWLGLLEEVRGPRCGEGEVRGMQEPGARPGPTMFSYILKQPTFVLSSFHMLPVGAKDTIFGPCLCVNCPVVMAVPRTCLVYSTCNCVHHDSSIF